MPEAYRLIVFNGAVPVRSIDTTIPAATYSAAQQIADFGGLPGNFGFTVAQKSPLYGPGHAATGSFTA